MTLYSKGVLKRSNIQAFMLPSLFFKRQIEGLIKPGRCDVIKKEGKNSVGYRS